MKKIKIAFFDIDGTILRFGKPDITAKTKEALNKLQENGIKICIATGRPLVTIPQFEGVDFDMKIAFNGSVCLLDNEFIVNKTIPADEVLKIIDNAAKMGRPLAVATRSRIVTNGCDDALREYFELASLDSTPSEEFEDALKEDVYQFMMGCVESEWDAVLEGTSSAQIAAWWDSAVDIIPKDSGKGNAIKKVLEHLNLSSEEVIAFGDGGNDVDMLETVGIGVAMGNAGDKVKAVANEVCGSVDEDGVYHYLKAKGLI
ncbi:MAG: HAD family hydrolase [Catonella sp.]|uniref:HAD family hydrolase n=1 Tax=Catonella sp. TaxID=2382125 RepID=UPI003F9ECAA8